MMRLMSQVRQVCFSTLAESQVILIQVKVRDAVAKVREEVEAARSPKSKLARARKKVINVPLVMAFSCFSILVTDLTPTKEYASMQVTKACSSTLASQATSICIVKKQVQVVMMMRMRLDVAAAQAKVEAAKSRKSKLAKARKKEINVHLVMAFSCFSILVMDLMTTKEYASMQVTKACSSTLANRATSICIVK